MQIGICVPIYTAFCTARLDLPRICDSALPQLWWVILWWSSPVQWLSVVVWLLVLHKLQVGDSTRSVELVAGTDGQMDAIPMVHTVLLQPLKGAHRKLVQPIREPRLGGRLKWRSMPAWKWCLNNCMLLLNICLCSLKRFVDYLLTACEETSENNRTEEECKGRENETLFWD
jgi:hypothetical protein